MLSCKSPPTIQFGKWFRHALPKLLRQPRIAPNSGLVSSKFSFQHHSDIGFSHVHVRDPNTPMNRAVTPTIIKGGCDLAYIMPNTSVPITTVSAALEYKACLQALAPSAQFLMTLYLHPSLTAATIAEAAAAGIVGVKAYPAGSSAKSTLIN